MSSRRLKPLGIGSPPVLIYVALWCAILVLLATESAASSTPWGVVVWLAVIVWWASGSRIAKTILLIGSLLTGMAVLIVEPSSGPDLRAIIIAGLAVLQVLVLATQAAWSKQSISAWRV